MSAEDIGTRLALDYEDEDSKARLDKQKEEEDKLTSSMPTIPREPHEVQSEEVGEDVQQ